MGTTSASGRLEVNLFLSEEGWKEPLWYNPGFSCIGNLKILHSQPFTAISMQTKQDPREPVLLMALKIMLIMLHAKLCLSMIIILFCVCWHPERLCRALSI